jgi:TfoX/Sxy family transcriptional regulator of competence genes
VAYDRELAERIRGQLAGVAGVSEQRMFGGLAFLVGGHMAVAAGGRGVMLVRVDPSQAESLLGDGVEPMVMRGRPLKGGLQVPLPTVAGEHRLAEFVRLGVGFARSLPPKG